MPRRRDLAAALLFFAGIALVATYPLCLSPARQVAGGLGDPILNATILAWDADRFRHGFRGFWDAPWLFPHHHTLAYSEHLIGIALFTAPVAWLTGNPVLTYNVAYVSSYAHAGFGMFLLARALWGRTDAAVLAGLAFAVTPYRLAQSTHLQMLISGWMPIALWGLHRYFETGKRKWLVLFTVAYVLLGLSNGYYLYFFLLPIAGVTGLELLRPRLPRLRIVGDLALCGAALAAVIVPIGVVYYRLQRARGFVRPYDDLFALSAGLGDYFRIAGGAWTWGGLLGVGGPERELFHGFVAILFAAAGACTVARRGGSVQHRDAWTRTVIAYMLVAAIAVWLSMGPGAWRPYGLLYAIVPGFNGLRVPARFSAIVALALAVLAGAGFTWLFERVSRATALVAAGAAAIVILVEGQHSVGLATVLLPADKTWDRVSYEWLRHSPSGGVLELDITQMNDFHPFTTLYQLNAVRHQHPIVNGYSGWSSVLQEFLGTGGSPLREPGRMADVLRGLRTIGVRYVLLHPATFTNPADAERIATEIGASPDQIVEDQRFGETRAWRLADAPATRAQDTDDDVRPIDRRTFELRARDREDRLPLAIDGNIDTRWLTSEPQRGDEWIEIRFPHATDVARVRIATGARGLVDYPRRLTVESVEQPGVSRTLFDGSILDQLIGVLAVDDRRAPVSVDLPPNQATTLRIRQTGQSRSWWSVHELDLWERVAQ